MVEGVAGVDGAEPEKIVAACEAPPETLRVLAGAHALHMSDERQLVGDPLEIAIMNEINWTLKGGVGTVSIVRYENQDPAINKRDV